MRIEDPRFKGIEKKIGVFVVLALAGIVGAIVLFGVRQDLFTKKFSVRFSADRGTGFAKGMPVKLSGFRIGRVTSIALNEQAMVDIGLEIDSKYHKWLRGDSTARLIKEGLVGDNIIDISVGSLTKPELKDNDTIRYVKTKALDELADEIADQVKPVLMEIKDIISYVNDPDGDLKRSIHNLEVLSRNLDATRQNADNMLYTATDRIEQVTDQVNATLRLTTNKIGAVDIAPTLTRVNKSLDDIDRRLPPMLDKADQTLANLLTVSHETKKAAEQALPRLPGLMTQTEELMLSSDKLINSIRSSWLFREPGAEGTEKTLFIRGDSHD